MNDEFLTISDLNRYIKDVVNAGFPQSLWICGEIQGYNRNRDKRHVFFEMVEKDEDSKDIVARIGLVIFSGVKFQIESTLKKSENAFDLKDDIEVKFLCKIDFYAPHGVVRLIVEEIDPVYTLGKLAQEKQKLIALLQKNGTLDINKQLDLPLVPQNIGLITSDDSAAYNDFVDELHNSGIGFKIYLRNALMQGQNAEADILKALGQLDQMDQLDAIVITRGGGSIADLSCFDSKLIAEKIATLSKPVLSGIGHEINISITDMAAHTFEKTPTAIGQFLVIRISEYLMAMEEKVEKIIRQAQDRIEGDKASLKNFALELQARSMNYFQRHHEQHIRFMEVLKYKPRQLLKEHNRAIADHLDLLKRSTRARFEKDQNRIKNYQKLIAMVHPLNTIKRGFSIARDKNGKAISKISQVKVNDELFTQLSDGSMTSQVLKIGKE